MVESLNEIQRLQFSNKTEAERRLRIFLQDTGAGEVARLELNPKPESLNSVNGFVTFADGSRFFFKSHTEEREDLGSYYNDKVLADAGYPVVQAQKVRNLPGQQIALYEIVSLPTLFDIVKTEEDKLIRTGRTSDLGEAIVNAQARLDRQIFTIYETTLQKITADEHSNAPIHQLFHHRIKSQGRYDLFYEGATLELDEEFVPYERLADLKWVINGVNYSETLAELASTARSTLSPSESVSSIIGHGDAHNGNVFYEEETDGLLYFDPAFAGRHHPLLDLTKPLFHNVFARWMYFPSEVAEEIDLSFRIFDDRVVVEHSFFPTQIRTALLESKLNHVLRPLCGLLRNKNALEPNWRQYLKSALFCCPMLTVNLAAEYDPEGKLAERYPVEIKMLGLAMAVEIAACSCQGTSAMRRLIDGIF